MRGGVWFNNIDVIPLPPSVLDLSRMGPMDKKRPSERSKDADMDVVEEGEQAQG